MKLLSAVWQMLAVLASVLVTDALLGGSPGQDLAWLPVIAGAAIGIGKKLLGGAAKKEIGRIAARGGALSGPVRSSLPPMGASGTSIGSKIAKAAGAIGAGVGVGVGVDAVTTMMSGRPRKKYRRQNVTNVKALNRALRRVEGFEKIVRRTFSISGTVKPKKRRSCR